MTSPERAYYPAVETHLIPSRHVAQTFRVQVMQPPQKRHNTQRFPVVYVTDGNAVFDMFKSISWLMQGSRQEWPPFMLVAIGYPGDSPVSGELLRGRDLTFPGCPDFFSGADWGWDDVLTPEEGTKSFGGAEDFQRFIGQELFPFIDATYPTRGAERSYFGHSAGGGFGLFTLFTETALFSDYIISSPILFYHGRTVGGVAYENHDFMLQRAREFIGNGRSLAGIRLYMSVGEEEEFDPLIANWQFTSAFSRMAAFLKSAAIPGLELTTEIFPGKTHISVWLPAFMRGIEAVLGARHAGQAPQA